MSLLRYVPARLRETLEYKLKTLIIQGNNLALKSEKIISA